VKATNGDGITATSIAIVNDRFDWPKPCSISRRSERRVAFLRRRHARRDDRHACRDGSRLRADHPISSRRSTCQAAARAGADPNKPFVGQIHNTALCCSEEQNASPFFRAAIASDVEVLKLMIKHGAQLEWSPTDIKKKERLMTVPPRGPWRQRQCRQDAGDAGDGGGRGARLPPGRI